MRNKEKHLKGADIILNLDEIVVNSLDSFHSSGCSGRVTFDINCLRLNMVIAKLRGF